MTIYEKLYSKPINIIFTISINTNNQNQSKIYPFISIP